jgi:hypothetical protein
MWYIQKTLYYASWIFNIQRAQQSTLLTAKIAKIRVSVLTKESVVGKFIRQRHCSF